MYTKMKFPGSRAASAAVLGALTATATALLMTGGSAMASAATTAATSCCSVTVNGPAITVKVTAPGSSALATFSGKAGQRVAEVITNPVSSDGGCATLTLLDPGGAPVSSGYNCGNGNPVGIDPVSLTISGTYTVRLTLDTTATGSGKLWVSAPVTVGTAAVNGPSAAMNVSRVGQGVQRTFSGKVGQRVAEVITNPVSSDGGCATLTLLDPGGAPVSSGYNCGNGNPVGIDPVSLPSTGTYTVRLEVNTTATATSKLWVSAPVTVGTAAVNGPSAAMNVSRVGQGVQRTFSGKVGQRVAEVITNPVSSDGGCATLTLLDPGGAPVSSGYNCGNGNAVGIDPVSLPSTGTYTVRLEVNTTATATSKLWVSAPVTVGTVAVNGPSAAMNVSRVGQGVQRTFSGKMGQSVSAVIGNPVTSDNGCTTLTLLDPGGAPVATGYNCGNGNPVSLGPATLPSTGTYTVRFEVNTVATGQGSLKVSAS
jgi:hypothetical protein